MAWRCITQQVPTDQSKFGKLGIAILLAIGSILFLLSIAGLWLAYGQEKLPPDIHVGTAMFRIVESSHDGEDAVVEPLLVPYFKLERLKGTGHLDKTIMPCDVIGKTVGKDDEHKIMITITVLKCGQQEYGLSEVLFQTEKEK